MPNSSGLTEPSLAPASKTITIDCSISSDEEMEIGSLDLDPLKMSDCSSEPMPDLNSIIHQCRHVLCYERSKLY